jgi:hypothetical protein
MADTAGEAAAGPGGETAFTLLNAALDRLVTRGVLPTARRPDAAYFVWSAVHGLAVLLVDGPLRGIPAAEADVTARQLVDSIERGL